MLIQRVITATILALLVLAMIFWLPLKWFEVAAALVVLLAAWEASFLFWQNRLTFRLTFLFSLLILFVLFQFLFPIIPLILLGVLWWLTTPFFLLYFSKNDKHLLGDKFLKLIEGLLIFLPCLIGLVAVRGYFGSGYLLYVLVVIWMTDIGAYFVGRFFGKHKLAEKISPKKTIEGLLGGVTVALITAAIGGFWLEVSGTRFITLLILVFVVSLWSVVGDLYESMLKRIANVKDSGHILPGHGGMYDRIDSLTAAIPIFVLGLFLFGG